MFLNSLFKYTIMATAKNFSELAKTQPIIIFEKDNERVDIVIDNEGYWGTMNKKYVQKVLRQQGRIYNRLVCHQTNPF